MITERGTHVVVRLEAVRHVNLEALLLELHKNIAVVTLTTLAKDLLLRLHPQCRALPAHPASELPHLGMVVGEPWAYCGGSSWGTGSVTRSVLFSSTPSFLNRLVSWS